MAQRMGLGEERVRVIVHFPVKSPGERQAYKTIIDALLRCKTTPNPPLSVTGFSYNTILPPPYIGSWFYRNKWRYDEIATILIDLDKAMSDAQQAASLEQELRSFKNLCFDSYKQAGKPQKEIWIAVQQIRRFD
jgi:hypothetical protein